MGFIMNKQCIDPIKLMQDQKLRESMLKLLSPSCKQFNRIYDNYEKTEKEISDLWDGGSVC